MRRRKPDPGETALLSSLSYKSESVSHLGLNRCSTLGDKQTLSSYVLDRVTNRLDLLRRKRESAGLLVGVGVTRLVTETSAEAEAGTGLATA